MANLAHWPTHIQICGDFNARCGDLDMDSEGLPVRSVIDVVENSQGEAFVDFLREPT